MHPLIQFLQQMFSGPAASVQKNAVNKLHGNPHATQQANPYLQQVQRQNPSQTRTVLNGQNYNFAGDPLPAQGNQGVPVTGVDGYEPQDTYGHGELDTNNFLQPSYFNTQASQYGGFQQPASNPNEGYNVGIQGGADPLGWMPTSPQHRLQIIQQVFRNLR